MTTVPPDASLEPLLERLVALLPQPGEARRVVGIAGPPGAGKTTLVEALLVAAATDARLRSRIAHLPMDGFHLPNAELDRLGRRDRKGAPDTFDAPAYAAVLAAVRAVPRRVVTAPAFDHAVGEPEPDALSVPLDADLVLTEGNYLLLDDPQWHVVRASLDEAWFCALGDDVRQGRLVRRHVAAGREPDDADAWVHRSDEANARLVIPGAAVADLVLVDGRVVEGFGSA